MTRTNLSVAAAACLAALTACTSTNVSTVWKNPDPEPVRFEKVLALVVNASPAERRAGEDELAAQIKSDRAVPAYTLIGDEEVKDKQKVLDAIAGQGFDAAAVIRLVSSDKKTTYVPPVYHQNLDAFSHYYGRTTVSPGYTVTDTFITAEVSLHSLRDSKLVWAGSSTTQDPGSIRDLVAQVAQAAGAELRRQGIIR